jgi:hypothetical protein
VSDHKYKHCLRITFDILFDDQETVLPVAFALEAIGAQIAVDLQSPVLVSGDILDRVQPPAPASDPPPARKEASPLN